MGIINRTRDINRQAGTWFPRTDGMTPEYRAMMQRWTVALVRSLKVHLRGKGDTRMELESVLTPDELEGLLGSAHRPNYCMQVMSEIIKASNTDTIPASKMDENMSIFHDCVGACERILRTPIPVSYTRHTSRILILYLGLLPMALWSMCGWATVPVMIVMSFMMLGIEEIGVSIEEPFTMLSLDAMCGTIQATTKELVEMDQPGAATLSPQDIVNISSVNNAVPA